MPSLHCVCRKLPGDLKALCANKTVVEAVLRSMQEEGRVSKLKGFEQVCKASSAAKQCWHAPKTEAGET